MILFLTSYTTHSKLLFNHGNFAMLCLQILSTKTVAICCIHTSIHESMHFRNSEPIHFRTFKPSPCTCAPVPLRHYSHANCHICAFTYSCACSFVVTCVHGPGTFPLYNTNLEQFIASTFFEHHASARQCQKAAVPLSFSLSSSHSSSLTRFCGPAIIDYCACRS